MEDKFLALKRVYKDESVKNIADELGVGKNMIGDKRKIKQTLNDGI